MFERKYFLGKFIMKIKKNLYSAFFLLLCYTTLFAQSGFLGNWDGQINIANKNISFQIEINHKNKLEGKLYIPEQNVFDLHLENLKIDSTKISFDILPAPQTANFTGYLIKTDSINGEFTQTGFKGKFFLIKTKAKVESKKDSLESNFVSKQVIFYNDKIRLAGTLTLPDTVGKFPAIVLLTGSGLQNRDENIFGFKIFKIIADNLTNSDYAVLRFDDRGIGGSTTGNTVATTADYAEDALSAIQFLKTQKNIIPQKIGLLGHSEGGLASLIAGSASNDVAFIILMAGPSVAGGDLVLYQMKILLKAKGTSQKIIDKKVNLEKKLISAIKNDEDLNKYKDNLFNSALNDIKLLPAENRANIKSDSTYAEQMAETQLRSLANPWVKFFFSYNPTNAIESLDCPLLILFGGKDMQVPVKLNKKPFETALKNADNHNYKIVVFPNANHLFQSAKSGLPEEYKKLDKKFVPDFISTIVNWLNEKVKENN